MDYALKTENIVKVYGNHKVVNNVSMHVKKGAIIVAVFWIVFSYGIGALHFKKADIK